METRRAVASLAALAQESRLRVYRLLVEAGPSGMAVGEIGASVHVAPATLSFHLKELFHAGLVASRQEGRFVYYSANYGQMNELLGFLTENCCARDGLSSAAGCRRPGGESKDRAARGSRAPRRSRSDASRTPTKG